VDLQTERLIRRVRERGIEVQLTDGARTLLGNLGYDPTYGARPLKRVIQKHLVDRLALAILDGSFREGDTVGVDVGEAPAGGGPAELTFQAVGPAGADEEARGEPEPDPEPAEPIAA
jgi:ATP-dependent Clp protease ATP-binding subunit ClpB